MEQIGEIALQILSIRDHGVLIEISRPAAGSRSPGR